MLSSLSPKIRNKLLDLKEIILFNMLHHCLQEQGWTHCVWGLMCLHNTWTVWCESARLELPSPRIPAHQFPFNFAWCPDLVLVTCLHHCFNHQERSEWWVWPLCLHNTWTVWCVSARLELPSPRLPAYQFPSNFAWCPEILVITSLHHCFCHHERSEWWVWPLCLHNT